MRIKFFVFVILAFALVLSACGPAVLPDAIETEVWK